jgi:hypothetical protein
VRVPDPAAASDATRLLGESVEQVEEPYDAAGAADALFLITEWSEFRQPDFYARDRWRDPSGAAGNPASVVERSSEWSCTGATPVALSPGQSTLHPASP